MELNGTGQIQCFLGKLFYQFDMCEDYENSKKAKLKFTRVRSTKTTLRTKNKEVEVISRTMMTLLYSCVCVHIKTRYQLNIL